MSKTKKKLNLTPLFLILTVLGFGGWLLFKSTIKPTPIAINEVTSSGTVTLSFTPPSTPLIANQNNSIFITIDTTSSKASVASVVVSYDPAKVSIASVTQGDFFNTTMIPATILNGKVSFTYSTPPTLNTAKQGTGKVATLNIKPLTSSPFTLTFDTGTMVAGADLNNNVLSGNILKTANTATYTPVTVVNGGWSAWSAKNTACGFTGNQTRTCTNPTPANGGTTCVGSATQAYTNPPCPIPGDLDLDNKVGIFDFNLLISKFGNPYTIFDFNNIVIHFGESQ